MDRPASLDESTNVEDREGTDLKSSSAEAPDLPLRVRRSTNPTYVPIQILREQDQDKDNDRREHNPNNQWAQVSPASAPSHSRPGVHLPCLLNARVCDITLIRSS